MSKADEMIAWAKRSQFRVAMFQAIQRLNREGKEPTGQQALKEAMLAEQPINLGCSSGQSNASQAIRDLIEQGFLTNTRGLKKRGKLSLRVGGVVSDMLEDEGRPRLEDGDYL